MEDAKKVERKRNRFAARLKSSKGVLCTDIPGPNIVICNVGQATGMEPETIYKLLKDNAIDIPQPRFIAEKGESHSFLVFNCTENATNFFNKFNGTIKQGDIPLYMNYVEEVPNTEIVCPHETPKGLTLLNDFITVEEEEVFMKLFDWTSNVDSSNLKNRQVKHYGYEFRYGSNDVDLNDPLPDNIPEECDVLWTRMSKRGFNMKVPDQLTVNKYCPGQGIPSHVDKHSPFGSTILSLSLGSDVVMDWKHHTGKYIPVVVQARSMLVMQDEARYDWQHGIQPRTYDPIIEERAVTGNTENLVRVITSDTAPRNTRISLTFRWTRSGPCECSYSTLCDSTVKPSPDDLEEAIASNLEELHVHQVYEQIAGHFSSTRHRPWPRVVQFVRRAPPGSVLLDLGCGNGKNILTRNDILQIACERSAGLLWECARRARRAGAQCVRLDLLAAGLRDRCADLVICIAVIHHFSTKVSNNHNWARRLQALATIHRLLRPGGRALVTVWAKDQTKSNYLAKNKETQPPAVESQVTVAGVSLPVHQNRTQFQHQDLLVPWKLRKLTDKKLSDKPENTLLRYYHVFEEGELKELCESTSLTVEDAFYEEGNWCVVCKKK